MLGHANEISVMYIEKNNPNLVTAIMVYTKCRQDVLVNKSIRRTA